MPARIPGTALAIGAVVVIAVAVAVALTVIDSPWTARAKRLDGQRAMHLQTISGALDCYWTLEKQRALPDSLDDLKARMEEETAARGLPAYCLPGRLSDPETGETYGYRPLEGPAYELCASFARASEGVGTYDMPRRSYAQRWAHPEGRHCFRLDAGTIDLPGVADGD
ncbi:hypothetical protein [Futiania mangrovi]|uniref:Uncharacterized protein n=1 Tax=Futiania mangrovi TaxID=2959716 RepID=A0A9J6PBA1_9PROT|nr:hypothetical protein [Futiania mangrovii]MCP1335745.1 hypothetical protein [Futiania mangrovii]